VEVHVHDPVRGTGTSLTLTGIDAVPPAPA
jgi:hypothetical protein